MSKEKSFNERIATISSPNETYEQQQLYYYTNKFWPFKQRATFPIEQILSSRSTEEKFLNINFIFYLDTRSAFPNAGPLETSSLTLFQLAFHGQSKAVRDLLMRRQTYVDVCDSRGLTALHFATYTVHINVVNVLLNFGANVNQLSDDGLTPLAIAFLLYYGNNPQQTINIALEHSDPVLLIPRPTPIVETRRLSTKDRILQQSRTTTNSPRNLLSRASIIEEDKLFAAPSMDSMKTNDTAKKSKCSIEIIQSLLI
jgi:ankyrin repeat protein